MAAIGTLLIPIIGEFGSAFLLGEKIGLRELTSLILIVIALEMVLIKPESV